MPGKIRGNGLSLAIEAKSLSEKLELTEVETLGESVIGELRELECTISAVVQSWYRIREEEEDICGSCERLNDCPMPMRLAFASVRIRECSSYVKKEVKE